MAPRRPTAEELDLEQANLGTGARCGAPHHTSGSDLPCIRPAGHEKTAVVLREAHAVIEEENDQVHWVTWLDAPLANTDPGTAP